MKLPDFEYLAPSTPAGVVQLLASRPGEAKILAGGQSLLPTMAFRLAQPSLLIDLRNLQELARITVDASGVTLGARTRWRDIEDDARLVTAHPLLVAAVGHVAHYQIRNRGTVGGSLAHADPAAELPCIAVTCEAELRLLGPGGERLVPSGEFFLGPLTTALTEDELILDVRLPAWPSGRRWAFREFAQRPGDFALAGIALFYDLDDRGRASNSHIGVVGACHCVHRLARTERLLNGKVIDAATAANAAATASSEVDPPGDIHADAGYRRALVATLLEAALLEAAERIP
ncbi:MAG: FAD binding domain-containing protein [Burkholderiales bacterium]|nr:FAD binding domain-containing protein [Burkholderiales bacterium]